VDTEQLKQLFTTINVWKRGVERAPHKPLLLLYALGKCRRGESRTNPYAEVDPALQGLLRAFGPPRKSYHSEYPFWRLQHDGMWELQGAEHVASRQSNTDAKKSDLLRFNVSGGFPAPIYAVLRAHPRLLVEIAYDLLERNFPPSIHEDIVDAVGLDLSREPITRTRCDPRFRTRILTIYGYTCAVCGFNLRLGDTSLGVEAAHIQWHQAGGPDIESNGLALCMLHHKLFDRGAFTVSCDRHVHVSEYAHGSQGFAEWLLAFHGQPIRSPQGPQYLPKEEYLHWHKQQVFRGPARYLGREDTSRRRGD
jgi:putative restriction endonuclease